MRMRLLVLLAAFGLGAALMGSSPALAQTGQRDGKLKIQVKPDQAYVFVDGKAIRDGSQTISLKPGNHIVTVRNYGYAPESLDVEVNPDGTTYVHSNLRASGGLVSGPFGEIELKGHPQGAVLLGGKTPGYFVGHVDEMDWDWVWQRLLVSPGSHLVTVTQKGETIWSGRVNVQAGKRVTVYLDENGRTETSNWPLGKTIGPVPRFHAGIATDTIALAQPAAELSAHPQQISCSESSLLKWTSANAVHVAITSAGTGTASDPSSVPEPPNGERRVNPSHTLTYVLTARGPDGVAKRTVTVNVSAGPSAKIHLSPSEIHVRRVGGKLVSEDSAKLVWSTSGASSVKIQPFGTMASSGGIVVKPVPAQTAPGPIDETVHYRLVATSPCGGTVTKTAALRLVGTNSPQPPVALASVFYPTDYPRQPFQNSALVTSQQRRLAKVAKSFNEYLKYDPKAKLLLVAHADVRGPKTYNQLLSRRRADSVKAFLISWGIPAGKFEIRALGKTKQLSRKDVRQLQKQNKQNPEKWMAKRPGTTWLAYNRRVDLILEPQGRKSTRAYPNDTQNARMLWQRPAPKVGAVEQAEQLPNAGTTQSQASAALEN